MKKIFAAVLALAMLCMALCALAEEGQPMFATYGEALDAARAAVGEEGGISAGSYVGEYLSVITEQDGKYYRHIADYDDRLNELESERDALEFGAEDFWEKSQAAYAAIEEYARTLPIRYSEMFTVEPIAQAELDALAGKTLAEVIAAGFEFESSGASEDGSEMLFTMTNSIFSYSFVIGADADTYEKASENGTEGELPVKSAAFAGVNSFAWELRFHTDGTVEEAPEMGFEMPEEMAEIMAVFQEIKEAAERGDQPDIDKLFRTIEEKFPEKKEELEFYRQMIIDQGGVDGLLQMFTGE